MRLLLCDRAFVDAGLDLIDRHITRPAKAGGGEEIPEAGGRGFDFLEQFDVVSPGDGSKQFWHKLCQNWIMAEHPGLEFLDELPVVGADGQRGVRGLIHFANPSSIFSASFSSFQNSASKSFAGVGGW